jgi:hypothetical protein
LPCRLRGVVVADGNQSSQAPNGDDRSTFMISQIGRQTQGVIVMRIPPDDQVVAIAPVAGIEEGDSKE